MINQGKRSAQLFASLVIAVILVVLGFFLMRPAKAESKESAAPDPNVIKVSDTGKKLADIAVEEASISSIQSELRTTGQVMFSGDQTVKIAPRLVGRVRDVFVKVGDHVTAGQTVAVMESVDAATAQTTALQDDNKQRIAKLTLDRFERLYRLGTPDVTTAQAAVDQAVAASDAAKTVLAQSLEQEHIGGFTEKPLEDAENALVGAQSTLSQTRADLTLAQKDYDRKVKLVEIGVAAQADLEISRDTLDKAKVNVKAGEDSVKLARQAVDREQKAFKSGLYGRQQVEAARAGYRQAILQQAAAEKALRLAKTQILRDLQQAESDFQSAVFDSENAHRALVLLGNPTSDGSVPITSPISGVITERDVNPGQVVDQSQMAPWQMFVVSNSDHVWVDADVYEKDIAQVRTGAPVTIQVPAEPEHKYLGAVLRIAPTVDKTSRSVKVRAEIENKGGTLKDGEYADVTLPLGMPHQALVIPLSAVDHEGDNDFVFVQDGDTFKKTQVVIGARQGQHCEVTSGLSPGQKIAAKGAIFLGGQVNDD